MSKSRDSRSEPPGPLAANDSGYSPWAERWLLPFVRDSTLWPVLLVVIAHAAAFLAPALLLALRDRRIPAQAALLLLAAFTINGVWGEIRRRGRVGALNVVVLCIWLLSAVLAVVADRYGIF
jgi:hypothetical protein